MEKVSIDVFANTNAPFCSLILHSFCEGYFGLKGSAIPFPLLLLPIPIILSKDLSSAFDRTNVKTGFLSWVKKNPHITIGLSERIESSFEITRPAIAYAASRRILQLDSKGEFLPNEGKLEKYEKVNELETFYKCSKRLGQWMGEIRSTKTIYNHLGITL